MDTTRLDTMICAMARRIRNGTLLAEGIGTFLPNAAYMLAKLTHAPEALCLCPTGNTIVAAPRTLSLLRDEAVTIPRSIARFDYVFANAVIMPRVLRSRPQIWCEFIRPAQIDPYGRTNNVAIGPWERPRVRLPGAAGIPDVTSVAREVYAYVPRHDPKTFVPRVDFISGAGALHPEPGGERVMLVFSDLGVFDFDAQGRMRIASLHPGVALEEVRAATGFELPAPDPVPVTPAPDPELLRLLRETVDPLGLRTLELLPAAERLAAIERLLAQGVLPAGTLGPGDDG